MSYLETGHVGQAAPSADADADRFFRLGMTHSTAGAADLISAHKWFNLAAMHGNARAARLRREIADEMTEAQIAAAQRAARDWATRH